MPPVRILRPALWCAGAVATIYAGCAAYEVRHDYRMVRKQERVLGISEFGEKPLPPSSLTYARIVVMAERHENPWTEENIKIRAKHMKAMWRSSLENPQMHGASAKVPSAELEFGVTETAKVTYGMIATNLGVFAMERLLPATSLLFSHVPASGYNFTLLTSSFGHVGAFHLFFNMYAALQFMPILAVSKPFKGSGSHLTAFYLSSGILSGFAYHLASVWPRPSDRFIPARGASGALMAVVGAYTTAHPDTNLGLVLIPGSIPAPQFMACLVAFEAYGLFFGFKRLPLAHASHLAGLAIGSAYVYFDLSSKLWEPLRKSTIGLMSSAGLIHLQSAT